MGDVGATIPNLPRFTAPLSPSIDGLALSAPGTDFSDCTAPAPAALQLDLSALAMLPPGTAQQEERHHSRAQGAVPDTDHITLQE
jgi:hypothetical protein